MKRPDYGWPMFNLVRQIRTRQQMVQVSRELAIATSRQVWQALAHLSLPTNRAEASGYIRAKTTPVVEGHLDAFYAEHARFDRSVRTDLGAKITERVVRLVLDEVVRSKAAAAVRKAA